MFNFSKRINRVTYTVNFAITSISLVLAIILLDLFPDESLLGLISAIIFIVFVLFTALYWICITRQRANDVTGKHALLLFAISWLTPLFLALIVWPGERKSNKYGQKPKPGVNVT